MARKTDICFFCDVSRRTFRSLLNNLIDITIFLWFFLSHFVQSSFKIFFDLIQLRFLSISFFFIKTTFFRKHVWKNIIKSVLKYPPQKFPTFFCSFVGNGHYKFLNKKSVTVLYCKIGNRELMKKKTVKSKRLKIYSNSIFKKVSQSDMCNLRKTPVTVFLCFTQFSL